MKAELLVIAFLLETHYTSLNPMSNHFATVQPVSIDGRSLRRVCGRFASGVTVATVLADDGAMHGMTATSFASVSLSPPLVLLCVGRAARILEHFRESRHFAVNILNDCQRRLSERFAGAGYDRFEGVRWHAGQTGAPLLADVLATLECSRKNMVAAGDHEILIGEVLYASCGEGDPLIHFGSRYRDLEALPSTCITG
jgi:flavin reductase (DIM6/NTAB) family NADH-FMN oxidoreductase RutF